MRDDDICTLCERAWVTHRDVLRLLRREAADLTGEAETSFGDLSVSPAESKQMQSVMLLCDGCDGSYHMVCVGEWLLLLLVVLIALIVLYRVDSSTDSGELVLPVVRSREQL